MSLAAATLSAILILAVGFSLAFFRGEPDILNRAGALIVCVEGLLLIVEFSRRARLRVAEKQFSDNPYFATESSRAEKQIVGAGILLAIVGEFLHGFGDILVELAVKATN